MDSSLSPPELDALKAQLERLGLENHFFKTIIDLMSDPVFLKDAKGNYLWVNKAVAQWLRVEDPATLIGKSADDIVDKVQAETIKIEDEGIIAGGKPILDKFESARRGDGAEVWVSITKAPLEDAAGNRAYIAGFRREATDRKKTEELLHDIVSNARCILWTARVKKIEKSYKWQLNVLSSKIARTELGLNQDSNELWQGLVSAAESKRMSDTAVSALRRNAAGYENEFTIKGLDGTSRNLREVVRITPITTAEWALVGVAMDVTEQEQAEQELQKSLSIVSATIESTEDGVLVVNKQGKIIFFNTRFAEMWGIPEHIILSCDDTQALEYAMNMLVDPGSFMKKVEEAYSQPDAIFYDILRFKDGRVFERHSHPQRTGGEAAGRVWVFRDISKRTRMEEQLAAVNARLIKLVKEDTLTSLLNRRTVLESAELEWSRWQRTKKPFSVLLIDIDDFKKINDKHGHITGDRALKLIADALKESVRGLDFVGRYGGEEFIVILPETPLDGAVVVAEKILESVRKVKLIAGAVQLPITASIGVVATTSQDKDIDALIHRADVAMYAAKRGGKNALRTKEDAPEPRM
ncbi:MAG TPA: diguanylate cyclase [Planctomycetota bacterium]|nr:diguanylate cyclase [Planctomycetota bacterium]